MDIIIIIAAICGGVFALLCYRRGLREGRALAEGMPIFSQNEKSEQDPSLARIQTILQNIDAYNGTAENQNEVI